MLGNFKGHIVKSIIFEMKKYEHFYDQNLYQDQKMEIFFIPILNNFFFLNK